MRDLCCVSLFISKAPRSQSLKKHWYLHRIHQSRCSNVSLHSGRPSLPKQTPPNTTTALYQHSDSNHSTLCRDEDIEKTNPNKRGAHSASLNHGLPTGSSLRAAYHSCCANESITQSTTIAHLSSLTQHTTQTHANHFSLSTARPIKQDSFLHHLLFLTHNQHHIPHQPLQLKHATKLSPISAITTTNNESKFESSWR